MIVKSSLKGLSSRIVHEVRPEVRGLKGVRVERKGRETLESWIKPITRDKLNTYGMCKFTLCQIRLK